MTPYFMVNEEILERTPPEIRDYLRCLRRHICQLESTDPQRRIEELEGTICGLHAKNEELKATLQQQQQQIHQLQQQLADAQARRNTNSTNSALPPSSDRYCQCTGQPVRGAGADGGGHLPAARPAGAGLPLRLHRVLPPPR